MGSFQVKGFSQKVIEIKCVQIALCEGAEEETQKEQLPKVEVEEEVCPESRIKDEDVCSETCRSHRNHVFVLSEAGKPIYSRYGTKEALSSTVGS
jgi:uncharacterized protein (DUF342 family)